MYPFGPGAPSQNPYSGPHNGPNHYGSHISPHAPYHAHSGPLPYTTPVHHAHPPHVMPPPHGYQPSPAMPGQAPHGAYKPPANVSAPIPPLSASYASQAPSQVSNVVSQEQRMLKVDMMQHAWAVVESDFLKNPIFVPPSRMNGAEDGDIIFVTIKVRPDGKLYAKVEKIISKASKPNSTYSVPSAHPSGPIAKPPTLPHAPLNGPYDPSLSASKPPPGIGKPANTLATPSSFDIWTPPAQAPISQAITSYGNPYGAIGPPGPRASSPSAPTSPVPNRSLSSSQLPAQTPLHYMPPSASNHFRQPSEPLNAMPGQHDPRMQYRPNVGYQAIPSRSSALIEGVLVIESATKAYVIPNDSEKIIHIRPEYLSGASNGEIVRVHIIPAKSTPEHLVGAIVFVVGLHPTMAAELQGNGPANPVASATANFYPDLEHWSQVANHPDSALAQSDVVPRSNSIGGSAPFSPLQHAHSTPLLGSSYTTPVPPNSTMNYPIPANHGAAPSRFSPSPPSGAASASSHQRRPSNNAQSMSRVELPSQLAAQLKQTFQSRSKIHPPTLSFSEFTNILDTVGEIEPLTRSLFDAIRQTDSKSSAFDHLSFEDYTAFIHTFLFGDESAQLSVSFSILDPQQIGVMTKEVLRNHTDNSFKLMLSLMLPVYLANPVDMTDYVWTILEGGKHGQVSKAQYLENMKQNRNAIIGLGLAQMPSTSPITLPKRGVPVYPGSPAWPLVIQMMTGVSRANQAVAGSSVTEALTAQSFRLCNRFELHTHMKVNHKLTFTDYAPAVFKKIRSLRGIDDAQYLYALGIEQLLGNFFFGRLTSLAKEVSTGKSGQFFFTSHDGRFLIKTIARHERNTLYKMLPSYLQHLQTYPSSLLVPIYGLHDIDQLSIIVMGNVVNAPYALDTAWDLKGSIVGRSSPHSFIKKDLDFDRGFVFGPTANSELANQIRLDAIYLKSMNIVDYSMFTGYHTLTKEEANTVEYRDLPPNSHPYFDRGLRSYDAQGNPKNEVWFMGIIDILIQFGVFKKAENFVKSLVHDPNAISIVPPDQYCERFANYLVSCIK